MAYLKFYVAVKRCLCSGSKKICMYLGTFVYLQVSTTGGGVV